MLHLVQSVRSYSPETISVMTAAFDKVLQSVSREMNASEAVKKALALIILRHVDRGERNPERLAGIAFHEWIASDRATGDRRATG